MAHSDISYSAPLAARVWSALASTARSVGTAINLSAAADRRLAEVERLNAKSDEELARLGLTRDQIAAHVFRDLMHI